jgi:(2Fe-2S) ferredoxin
VRSTRSSPACWRASLGVCVGGPIVVVYPGGTWYKGVTPDLLDRIVVEHLKHGRPVEEAIFYTQGDAVSPDAPSRP